jgi:hypothetical protein
MANGPSYMVKYLHISSYSGKPFLIWLCNRSHSEYQEIFFSFFFISVPSSVSIPLKVYPTIPYPFKADIIWCDGTFKNFSPTFLVYLLILVTFFESYIFCLRQKRQLLSFSSPKVFTRFCVWVSQVTIQTFTSEKGVCCLISSAQSPPPSHLQVNINLSNYMVRIPKILDIFIF